MAEPESNLKVKLFISLKKQFPRLPEHVVRSVMKQFNNDKDKCLEELNKNPLNTISSVNNSMQKLNLEIKNTDVSQASVTSKYNKNSSVTSHSPELNSNQIVDFDQYKHVPNSSMIPHITCKTSTTPQRQISVQHIQTSDVDLNSYKYSMPQMYCNYSSSPHNDKLHWPTLQKNADPLVMSTPVASSSQHSTHANIYIEAHPNMNKGQLLEYDHQVSMLHPVTSTLHSPQPSLHGSQPPSPYSPQSVTGNHSPRLVGQYVNSKHSPSTQISQQLDYHQLAESPFKYQFANMHGYAPSVSQHQHPIAINSKTALHYRPTKNTYVHSVNPNVSGLPSQSENLVYPIGTSQDDQAYTKALLNHQRQRYEKLSEDYNNLIKTTQELSSEIDAIQRNKTEQNIPTPADFYKIQAEIKGMLKELDAHNNGQTPIGVLDPSEQQNFYKNMNTGQSGSLFARELTPPPLPPRHPETPPTLPMNDFEGEHWNCAACTFLNHPALERCEECEFPRNSKGRVNNTTYIPHSRCNHELCYCHDR